MATEVQKKVLDTNSTIFTARDITFDTPTTPGNTIIAAVTTPVDANISASDLVNGAYTLDVQDNVAVARAVAILSFRNAGSVSTVTVAASVSGSGRAAIYEVSGLDNGASPQIGRQNLSATTAQTSSSTPLTGTGFIVATSNLGANAAWSPISGWTGDTTGATSRIIQHVVGTVTASQGAYTTASATSTSVMAVYSDAVAAGVRSRSVRVLQATARASSY